MFLYILRTFKTNGTDASETIQFIFTMGSILAWKRCTIVYINITHLTWKKIKITFNFLQITEFSNYDAKWTP